MRPARLHAPLLALALALAGAGCGNDFTPRSVLTDLRVLALQGTDPDSAASPPAARLDLQPGERITLTPYRVLPPGLEPGATLEESWTFCPFSLGASAAYDCAVPLPACNVSASGSSGAGTYSGLPFTLPQPVDVLIQRCLDAVATQGAPAPLPAQVPARLDLVFQYTVRAPDGSSRTAVQLVPYYPGGVAADQRNQPLRLDTGAGKGVVIGGQPATPEDFTPPGRAPPLHREGQIPVTVNVDPTSVQTYQDATGVALQESMVVSFFATFGRFDFDRGSGPAATVWLKDEDIPTDVSETRVWAVMSDLRGGETVLGPYKIPIASP